MKKVLALVLALVLVLSLAACGGSSSSGSEKNEQSLESRMKEAVELKVISKVSMLYKIQGSPSLDSYVREEDENNYTVTGKVTVKDDYGDTYSGKYTANVEYNPDKDKITVKDCDIDTPTKNGL